MTYRNPKLLRLAAEAPHCMSCFKTNDGSIVACHSNQIKDGKGTGHKAADYRIFYGCNTCHDIYDRSKMKRYDKEIMFEVAHRNTIGWLFESGRITI